MMSGKLFDGVGVLFRQLSVKICLSHNLFCVFLINKLFHPINQSRREKLLLYPFFLHPLSVSINRNSSSGKIILICRQIMYHSPVNPGKKYILLLFIFSGGRGRVSITSNPPFFVSCCSPNRLSLRSFKINFA